MGGGPLHDPSRHASQVCSEAPNRRSRNPTTTMTTAIASLGLVIPRSGLTLTDFPKSLSFGWREPLERESAHPEPCAGSKL
jgi:hypothetical protein